MKEKRKSPTKKKKQTDDKINKTHSDSATLRKQHNKIKLKCLYFLSFSRQTNTNSKSTLPDNNKTNRKIKQK